VISDPLVTVITSISREHWQQLGNTIAEIAGEKAGILKPGCPAVVGILPPDAEDVVRSLAQELQCPLITPQPATEIHPGWAEYQSIHNSKLIKYPLPLQGQIQLNNSALALATLEILQRKGWQISEEAIINGMAKTKWTGRMQWVNWHNHKLLIDGAHNPAAAQVLRNYVDTLNTQNITWVMGMLSTKDHTDIFKFLLKPNDRLYLVPVPDNSSANPIELAKLANDICPDLQVCQIYPDLISSLTAAVSATDSLVVLCGSLYLIGHFLGKT
jgi:dihydrofolate synthase/folylpolyglutamate synthase